MRFQPIQGSKDIAFGASYDDVIRVFGNPDTDESLHDVESHPIGRRTLKYDEFSVTIGSEIGVCGMGTRIRLDAIYLWETMINDFTTRQFTILLASHGAESETAPLTAWGLTDIFSAAHGILAYFADDKIEQINIHIPYSVPSEY